MFPTILFLSEDPDTSKNSYNGIVVSMFFELLVKQVCCRNIKTPSHYNNVTKKTNIRIAENLPDRRLMNYAAYLVAFLFILDFLVNLR